MEAFEEPSRTPERRLSRRNLLRQIVGRAVAAFHHLKVEPAIPDTTANPSVTKLFGTMQSGHNAAMLTLAITGFIADPSLVTQTLGFEPTSIGRKGEPSKSGRPRTFNGWWHDVEGHRLVDGGQHADALTRMLALLRGREDQFARLMATVEPQKVSIYGGLYVSRVQQCGVWLDPDQMHLLAACNVGWGLDLLADE